MREERDEDGVRIRSEGDEPLVVEEEEEEEK